MQIKRKPRQSGEKRESRHKIDLMNQTRDNKVQTQSWQALLISFKLIGQHQINNTNYDVQSCNDDETSNSKKIND